MTDALCGPSNPLQQFQKHSQADRSLQQDRLIGARHLPGEGFRSLDPRAGSLDAEFHAFENALPNPLQFEQPRWQQPQIQYSHFQPSQPMSSNWATDFQNMNLTDRPLPVSQFRAEAPLIKTAPNRWEHEFMASKQGLSDRAISKQPAGPMIDSPHAQYLPAYNLMPHQPISQDQGFTQDLGHDLAFDESAFESAFQTAFDSMQAEEPNFAQHQDHFMTEQPYRPEPTTIVPIQQAKYGSDAIEYTESDHRTAEFDERDAGDLARVAGELLDNVSHEQNEKFKNSSFLDLMRRIRDKEITVQGEDLKPNFDVRNVENTRDEALLHDQDNLKTHDPNTFSFPDMNEVYGPDAALDFTIDDGHSYEPRNQISALHPGGPRYPGQSPVLREAEMSGAIGSSSNSALQTNSYASA